MLLFHLIARVASGRFSHEDGQGVAEYAPSLCLIAVVSIIALIFLGGQVSDTLDTVGTAM